MVETGRMEFWDGHVQLIVFPEERMTWRMWTDALWAMRTFVKRHKMSYQWSYFILQEGMDDLVGKGALMNGFEDGSGMQIGTSSNK